MSRWASTSSYDKDSVVVGSDDAAYVSQINANRGNDPTTDTSNWHSVDSTAADATALALKAPLLASPDQAFAAHKGPVLVDESDGHTYRIKVTAGVLGVTQIT